MVKVSEQDIKDAFEANTAPRMRCRIIMTNEIRQGQTRSGKSSASIPAGFERLAKELSMDTSTRCFWGMLLDLMARHAYPRNISDAAFAEPVDGDPTDPNPRAQAEGWRHYRPDPGQRHCRGSIVKREEYVFGGKSGTLGRPQHP